MRRRPRPGQSAAGRPDHVPIRRRARDFRGAHIRVRQWAGRHPPSEAASVPTASLTWAERLRRVFGMEITVCPHCGGRLRVIADVTDPEVIDRILEHVRRQGLPRAPPARSTVA